MSPTWPRDRVWTESFAQFAGPSPSGQLAAALRGSWWRLGRRKPKDAPLAAVINRTRSAWRDARVCVLWDGDACLVSSQGLIIADVQSERVTGVPIGAIDRVVRYDQPDPSRRVADLDPGAHARTTGLLAGFVGKLAGASIPVSMGGAVLLNRMRRDTSDPVEWNHVEIRLRDPGVQPLKLTLCQDRAAAHEIEQTINAALR